MDRIKSHFTAKAEELELHIGTREQGINARKAFGVRLGNEIRELKNQSKVIASNNMSTKYLDKNKREMIELFNQNINIVKHLKKDLADLKHEAFCYRKVIDIIN